MLDVVLKQMKEENRVSALPRVNDDFLGGCLTGPGHSLHHAGLQAVDHSER